MAARIISLEEEISFSLILLCLLVINYSEGMEKLLEDEVPSVSALMREPLRASSAKIKMASL